VAGGAAALAPQTLEREELEREVVARVALAERVGGLEEALRDLRSETEMRDNEHEARLRAVETQVGQVDGKVDVVKQEVEKLDGKVDQLDSKLDKVLLLVGQQGTSIAMTSSTAAQAAVDAARASRPDRGETSPRAPSVIIDEGDSTAPPPDALATPGRRRRVNAQQLGLAAMLGTALAAALLELLERWKP
jgi:hypothetical protein